MNRDAVPTALDDGQALRLFEELATDAITIHAGDGTFLWVSANAAAVLGWRAEQLLGRIAYDLIHPDDLDRFAREHAGHDGSASTICMRLRDHAGAYEWFESSARARIDAAGRPDRIIAVVRRVSHARVEQLEQHRHANEQTERELRHRVNNSLQVIASMLSLRTSRAASEETREVLAGLRARVLTLAALDELLDERGLVRARGCLEQLTAQLQRLYPNEGRVVFELHVDPGLSFAPKQAMPIALITIELLSNALLHAFPRPRRGTVRVSAGTVDGVTMLDVRDDGIGFDPSSVDADCLGLRLAQRLAESFGGLHVQSQPGTGTRAWMGLQV